MIGPEYCTPERTAYFIQVVRAISGDCLNPGFGRVTEADEKCFTISLTIFNSHVERFAKANPDLVEEERQRFAAGDRNPQGEKPQALSAKHESAVTNEVRQTPDSQSNPLLGE